VPRESGLIFNSEEAGDHSPSFSDVVLQNERAMWRAEFDSIGEEAVRSNFESNSYTPTGMEVARQWLARRESSQFEDVQSNRSAENVPRSSSDSLKCESEQLTLASRVEANSRAILENAADTKRIARGLAFIGVVTLLFSLGVIMMVLASSRQIPPNSSASSALPFRPIQALVPPPPPAVPLAKMRQASAIPPEIAEDSQPSNSAPVKSPILKPESQSLAKALALIAAKLGREGTVNFAAQFHDFVTGRDHIEQLAYKTSNVSTDPNRCRVKYHLHIERDGRAVSDQYRTVELRRSKSIKVRSIDAEPGRRVSVRAYPKVYVMEIARWGNSPLETLYFYDKNMASQVGMAIRRATELCDNGQQRFRRH